MYWSRKTAKETSPAKLVDQSCAILVGELSSTGFETQFSYIRDVRWHTYVSIRYFNNWILHHRIASREIGSRGFDTVQGRGVTSGKCDGTRVVGVK